MPWQNNSVLVVVPARGGSKGIPRKNLQLVGGMSLVARAASVVARLPWVDRAVLSTDDAEIADEGARAGLAVPFMRPPSLAADSSRSVDMWRHAWLECEAIDARRYDISILLEPTSPLRRPEDVERTVTALLSGDYAAAATISSTPAHYSPHKTLTLGNDGMVGFYLPDGARYARRQDIPQYYHRNGACYAVRRSTVVDQNRVMEEGCVGVVIDRPLVNIDDLFDLELTEFLVSRGY